MVDLVRGLENLEHVVVIKNLFTCIDLFQSLAKKGIYAIRTAHTNYIGPLNMMKETKKFGKNPQGYKLENI
jgi:hypothetical protein